MALKHRIEKLELRMGKPGDNVPVLVTYLGEQTKAEAIARSCRKKRWIMRLD